MSATRKLLGFGLIALLVGCGTGGFVGLGDVVVTGVTTPINACVSEPITVTGNNFLSEHGEFATVRFEAISGTPFLGGTSAVVEVQAQVLSNTEVEMMSPEAVGQSTATITVILAGGAQGSSTIGLAQITGGVLGPPIARDDSYDAIGNLLLTVDPLTGVLDNDEPGGCRPEKQPEKTSQQVTLAVTDFDATSVLGGQVQVNPDGSFSYNPPVGLEGSDSFTYEMTDGNDSATATVRIQIEQMVWFIDDTAVPGGDGRFTSPFIGLGPFNAIQGSGNDEDPQPGDNIFIYEGTGNPYDGGIVLLDFQNLIGEGIGLDLGSGSIVPAGSPPLLTQTGLPPIRLPAETAGGPCIVLADENTIRGLIVDAPSGEGIIGFDVSGPTNVDDVIVRDTGLDGIALLGQCTGTFTFGTNVTVENAGNAAVRLLGFTTGFDGIFNFHGTITEPAGTAIDVDTTTASSEIHFTNGSITALGGVFTFNAIRFNGIAGLVEVTSTTTIEGTPFNGILCMFCDGNLSFDNTTITTQDGGLAASGVNLTDNVAGTFTFDDLNVTMTGENTESVGGVPLRIENFSQIPNLTTAQVVPTNVNVTGISALSVLDGEEVIRIDGGFSASVNLDVTFASLSGRQNPIGAGMFIAGVTGVFTVTGTTEIRDPSFMGIDLFDSACNFTFATVTIDAPTGTAGGNGLSIFANSGTFTVNGGTIDNYSGAGAHVTNGTLNLSDVTISNVNDAVRLNPVSTSSGNATLSMNACSCSTIADDVVEMWATVTLSGTGNTASAFGTLCENNATSVTGSIDFGASGTCP